MKLEQRADLGLKGKKYSRSMFKNGIYQATKCLNIAKMTSSNTGKECDRHHSTRTHKVIHARTNTHLHSHRLKHTDIYMLINKCC